MADIQIIIGYETVTQADQAFKILDKTVKSTARQYEQAFNRITSWQKKFSNEQNKAAAATNKFHLSQQLSNKSARDSAALFERQAKEVEKLSLKYKPLYAVSNLYETKLEEINRAQKLGVLNDKQREASLEQLNMEFKNGTGAFASYGNHANQTARKTNQLGVMMQQTGYQVGDFAVQVGSGQNIMVAFGQQATQLVGTMAMFAKTTKLIALFSGLGIAIPVITGIAAAFMRTKSAADDSGLAVKAFEERLKSAKEETVEMTEKLKFLQSGFGTKSEYTLQEDFAAATAELERLETRLANAKGPDTYFESEANRLVSVGLIEDAIALQTQEKDLAEDALQTYLDTLSALELEEFQREENLRLQKEAEIAAENYKDMVEATTRSQADQLALATKIFVYGKDHLQVAKLRAEQEGISKGLIGDELNEYILMEMVIRDVVSATEEAADATASSAESAERFARALESAALAGQTLASLKFEFSAGGRSMSLYAGRSTTSDKSIEGDLPEGYGEKVSSRGGGGGKDFSQNEYLSGLQDEAKFKRSLVSLSAEQVTEAERRREIIMKIQSEGKVADEDRIKTILRTEAATRSAIEAEEQRQATMDMITGNIESAFMSMVDGSKSVEDAFKGMLRNIILAIYQEQVAKPFATAIGNAIFGSANGNVFSGGSHVKAYANGGVVNGPTTFPMNGGQTGLMGEAGPEAIMPLKRGANGKLGVQMEGGGGDTINVVQNFNFQANGDDTVKKLIAQAAPKIAQMTKSSLLDDRRRGGSTKAAFG